MRARFEWRRCRQCGADFECDTRVYQHVCPFCWLANAVGLPHDAREWQCGRCGGDSLYCSCRKDEEQQRERVQGRAIRIRE